MSHLQAVPPNGLGEPRRAFTGVLGIVPDADQPEHVAYVDYERELAKRLAEVEAILHKTFELHDRARRRLGEATANAEQDLHEEGIVHWLFSGVRREPAQMRQRVAFLEEEHQALQRQHHIVHSELAQVRQWVQEYLEVAQAEIDRRAAQAAADLLEAECAVRDANPRPGMRMMTAAEFAAEDPRRLGSPTYDSAAGPNLAGADCGFHWRRDCDDDPSPFNKRPGRWRISWNPLTEELYACRRSPRPPDWDPASTERSPDQVLLIGRVHPERGGYMPVLPVGRIDSILHRQDERNSLALVLDLYESELRPRTHSI